MTKSNTFMSYKGGVTITPGSGSAVTLSEVTDVSKIRTQGMLPWRADGKPFPTVMAMPTQDRGLTISSGDLAGMAAVPVGVPLTIVATVYDALNNNSTAAGSGALTETWTNAYVVDTPSSGPTNQFAGGTISFMCGSVDGTTDPYSYSQA